MTDSFSVSFWIKSDNKWRSIVVTYDGKEPNPLGAVKFYIDGEENYDDIAHLAPWSRALDHAEVRKLHNKGEGLAYEELPDDFNKRGLLQWWPLVSAVEKD